MSPEQVEGREVGAPSDIFSLGAVLTFAATGEAPFGSGSAPTLAYRAVYRQVNLDRVPTEVRGLIQRCLAKDPAQRPTARDLQFGAGAAAVPPTERWLPEAAFISGTRTFLEIPDHADSSQTRPGQHEGRVGGDGPARGPESCAAGAMRADRTLPGQRSGSAADRPRSGGRHRNSPAADDQASRVGCSD